MCLLLETIKVENRQPLALQWHEHRMNQSRYELFGISEPLNLRHLLQIPEHIGKATYKCRVLYGTALHKIEFVPYRPKRIARLKVVHCNHISYHRKLAQRTIFAELRKEAGCSDNEDIIIIKNGLVTDASFANLAFFDARKWLTPATPLLNGTMRQRLLKQHLLQEAEITETDLYSKRFIQTALINAMLPPPQVTDNEQLSIHHPHY